MKTRSEPRGKALTYWKKARRFAESARMNAEAHNWDPCVASAVNAVVNLADALCVHYTGQRSASESHQDALTLLRGVSGIDPTLKQAMEKHLGALLSMKALAQYEGRLVEAGDGRAALQHMDRAFGAASKAPPANEWSGQA